MTGESQLTIFKDSLNEKSVGPGHVIVNFGKGTWNKSDKNSFKIVLSKVSVIVDGRKDTLRLPGNIQVVHYGLFVNELVVKISELK